MKMYRPMIWVRTVYRGGVKLGDFLKKFCSVLMSSLLDDQCIVVLGCRDELAAIFRATNREDDRELGVLLFVKLNLLVLYCQFLASASDYRVN